MCEHTHMPYEVLHLDPSVGRGDDKPNSKADFNTDGITKT